MYVRVEEKKEWLSFKGKNKGNITTEQIKKMLKRNLKELYVLFDLLFAILFSSFLRFFSRNTARMLMTLECLSVSVFPCSNIPPLLTVSSG